MKIVINYQVGSIYACFYIYWDSISKYKAPSSLPSSLPSTRVLSSRIKRKKKNSFYRNTEYSSTH